MNQRNEITVGSNLGHEFSIQFENKMVSTIEIAYNEYQHTIRQIKLTFTGEDQVYSVPSQELVDKLPFMKKDTTAKFEFAQNEHLTGRIFMSENPTGQLC